MLVFSGPGSSVATSGGLVHLFGRSEDAAFEYKGTVFEKVPKGPTPIPVSVALYAFYVSYILTVIELSMGYFEFASSCSIVPIEFVALFRSADVSWCLSGYYFYYSFGIVPVFSGSESGLLYTFSPALFSGRCFRQGDFAGPAVPFHEVLV